ncbi:hypothetical protein BH18THE2_BH18THE2_27660 [soil metagenome]
MRIIKMTSEIVVKGVLDKASKYGQNELGVFQLIYRTNEHQTKSSAYQKYPIVGNTIHDIQSSNLGKGESA